MRGWRNYENDDDDIDEDDDDDDDNYKKMVTQARMTYSTAEGREPRFVVSDGSSHLDIVVIIIIFSITFIIAIVIIIIIITIGLIFMTIIIPDDVFNALGCKDE